MLYIKKDSRKDIDRLVGQLIYAVKSLGDVNYAITKFLHLIILRKKLCYDSLNSMIGVLECAKLELYRMVVAKYGNKKRMENGPISDLDAKSLEDVR